MNIEEAKKLKGREFTFVRSHWYEKDKRYALGGEYGGKYTPPKLDPKGTLVPDRSHGYVTLGYKTVDHQGLPFIAREAIYFSDKEEQEKFVKYINA